MDQKWDMEILSVEKFAERYEELFHRSLSQANCITFVSARRKIGVRQWRGRCNSAKRTFTRRKNSIWILCITEPIYFY